MSHMVGSALPRPRWNARQSLHGVAAARLLHLPHFYAWCGVQHA